MTAPIEQIDPKTTANRANAQHSTGPRTPEGKAASSQNAVKHGLASAILPADPAFLDFLAAYQDEFRPATRLLGTLVREVAHVAWKLQQIPAIEHHLMLAEQVRLTSAAHDPAHLSPLPATDHDPLTSEAIIARQFFENKPTPLTRLWSLHARLVGRFTSLLRQIHRLQNEPTTDPEPHSATDHRPSTSPATITSRPSTAASQTKLKPPLSTTNYQPSTPQMKNEPILPPPFAPKSPTARLRAAIKSVPISSLSLNT